MTQIDPQQELFTALKLAIEGKGYDEYDGFLPPDNTPYPFVYLGNFRQSDSSNKSGVLGEVYGMIHVWHDDPEQRGTVSAMLLDIKRICRSTQKTDNFEWILGSCIQNIIPDTTTKNPLLHGVLEVTFKFS